MSKIEAPQQPSIWHTDLHANKLTRNLLCWLVYIPALVVQFVCVAIIFGAARTTLFFICIFAGIWLHDAWQARKVQALTTEEQQLKAESEELMLRFAFDDYWYLRGYFISLMLDIKDPIEGPWYDRNTVRQFITLWEYQWLVDSISPRLNQVGRKAKADSKRIAHLHAIAPNVGKTFDKGAYFDSRPHSAKQAQIIDSFFEEVTTTLISIDRWFAKEHWPDNFQVDELWGELNDISLQTATENAPFKRG